ncbi:MAG: hypothetical protein ACRD0J_00345 [Acidimicrobiales bacterium]
MTGPITAGARPATLWESARRVGAYRWVERRLFECLGGWVATVPEPSVRAALSAHSYHHAWHAELWRDRLPELAGADPEELTTPGHPGRAGFMAALERSEGTAERLVGVYRVLLPRLVVAYRAHLDRASPVSDGPVARALGLVLHDDVEDWAVGEGLLQAALTGEDEVGRAARHQGRLEAMLVSTGGL